MKFILVSDSGQLTKGYEFVYPTNQHMSLNCGYHANLSVTSQNDQKDAFWK